MNHETARQARMRRNAAAGPGEDVLADALEALTDGVALFGADGRLITCNGAFRALAGPLAAMLEPGLRIDRLALRAVRGGFYADTEGREGALLAELERHLFAPAAEFRLCRYDGVWLGHRLRRTRAGRLQLTVGDITETLSAIIEEGEHAAFLAKIVDACPANLLMTRVLDGRVLFRSRASEALFGAADTELLHWANPNERLAYVDGLLRKDRVDDLFVRARRADGSVFPAQISARLVEHGGERVVVSTTTDLTEAFSLRDQSATANARLRDGIESLHEGFALFDAEDRLVLANDRYREANREIADAIRPGATRREILEAMCAEQVVAQAGRWLREYDRDRAAGKSTSPESDEVTTRDGKVYLVNRSPTKEGGVVMTWLDITDRRRTEARARGMLNDAIQALGQGLVLYDAECRFVMGNRRLFEMFYSRIARPEPGEPARESLQRLAEAGVYRMPAETAPEGFVDALMADLLGYAKDRELPLADGRVLVCSSHSTPLGGYLVTYSDETARRRAEQASREADELVRTIVEACPTTFLVSRVHDGKVIYCPPPSRDRFGNVDSTLSFFLQPQDRERYLAALLPTGAVDDYPIRFRKTDGTVMHGLTSARVIQYRGEDVIISSTRDVTEQLAMQEELERQREIAHQNEKLSALGELLAGVAHELNNPLSIVVGYAQMLEGRVEDPILARRVERIAQSAGRCAKIVRTFLAMARQRPTRLETCSLNEIVETAVDVACYGLRTAGAETALALDPALPPVEADPDQMAQVFTNLIVNAEHALAGLGADGRLAIASWHDRASGDVVVEVADNGPGVPEEIRARIFEPFFTTKEVGSGTGIGLAFSHRIVHAHGGRIVLVSRPGEGARFQVRLAACAAGDTAAAPPCGARAGRPCRVLVVDDEPDVAELVREILEERGCSVETRLDARAALALLATERFDAILSDMRMPDMNGEAFLAALARQAPDQARRLAFVTGDGMSPHVAAFLGASGRPHLEKPVDADELAALVTRLAAGPEGETA